MLNGLGGGLKAILIGEAVIALCFLAWAWSATSATIFGRMPSLPDIIAISMPLLLVILAAAGAATAARNGQPALAWGIALVPFPVALFLFGFFGIV